MMFLFHTAFTLGLIALVLGVSLYCWSIRTEGAGTGLAKIFGFLVIIFAILAMLCTGYYGVKYWQNGNFETPMGMPAMHMMQMQNMMQHMMDGGNMSGGNMTMPGSTNNQNNAQQHSAHHQP